MENLEYTMPVKTLVMRMETRLCARATQTTSSDKRARCSNAQQLVAGSNLYADEGV